MLYSDMPPSASTTAITPSLTAPLQAERRALGPLLSGRVRKGRRTKELVKRVKPGDIVLIDHIDLDAMAAEALVERRPLAVIDAAAPITGRYPNRGPSILAAARIPLFSLSESDLFNVISEGVDLNILPNGDIEQHGVTFHEAVDFWDKPRIELAVATARGNLGNEIQRFAENTLQFVRTEADSLIAPTVVPNLTGVPSMDKRHVVIVVRGQGYREDLASIRGYLSDFRPILIGVDGGADALLESGIKPHIILGDMDSVSDKALKCGAKLIVHAYSTTGDAPGMERLTELGLAAETFPVPGTSEDAAMLLAHEKGAELIVAVGTHSNLEDFLDKGRAGMASTFLTRLKVGSRLVDARGVSKLRNRKVGTAELVALTLSAVFVVVALFTHSPVWSDSRRLALIWWRITLVNLTHHIWHLRFH